MTISQIQKNWNHIKFRLKKDYEFLKDEDLDYFDDEEILLKSLQDKLNKTRGEVLYLIYFYIFENGK